MSERKIAACRQCGETREIAAHGLCFACYRQWERGTKRPTDPITDTKQQKRLLKAHTALNNVLIEIDASPNMIAAMRVLLSDHFRPIQHLIGPAVIGSADEWNASNVEEIEHVNEWVGGHVTEGHVEEVNEPEDERVDEHDDIAVVPDSPQEDLDPTPQPTTDASTVTGNQKDDDDDDFFDRLRWQN